MITEKIAGYYNSGLIVEFVAFFAATSFFVTDTVALTALTFGALPAADAVVLTALTFGALPAANAVNAPLCVSAV